MLSSKQLVDLFFSDLKRFNSSNFRTIATANIQLQDASVHKAYSSIITRYFIFKEKHPEISEVEHRMLYYKLKLDLVANYFSEYPDTDPDNLVAFQVELQQFLKRNQVNQGQVDGDVIKEEQDAAS